MLTKELEGFCRNTYEQVGKHRVDSYEQWEFQLLRTTDEVLSVWAAIADAHRRYMTDHSSTDPSTVVSQLLIAVTGDDNDTTPYYQGPMKPLPITQTLDEETLDVLASPGVQAVMSKKQYCRLATRWTKKAACSKCPPYAL